jgi:hypothetical protein
MFTKDDLQHGMIVKSSDGRYGMVCIKDATDVNCIKFFYDPQLTYAHGSVEKASCGDFIVPLAKFTYDMRYICSKEEAEKLQINWNESMTLWSIQEVYSLKKEWMRSFCISTCNFMRIKKEFYDNVTIGCCAKCKNAYVGTMDEIHKRKAPCIAESIVTKTDTRPVQISQPTENIGDTQRF